MSMKYTPLLNDRPRLVLSLWFGLLLFCIPLNWNGGSRKYQKEIQAHQQQLNDQYTDSKASPLSAEQIDRFVAAGKHPFFTIDRSYRTLAKLERLDSLAIIGMKTSTTRIANYSIYGTATFKLQGRKFSLTLYRSTNKAYSNYLFLPFTDETSGEMSYGGGRYINLDIPKGNRIFIDFNKSYHPYCAYTNGYSCPIPPPDNHIDIAIKAGIQSMADDW